MNKDILTFVTGCDIFLHHKGETVKIPIVLHLLPIPTSIWTNISMEFIMGLPKEDNKPVIMVVADLLSKYANFYALPNPFTPTLVAQVFIHEIFKMHGMPISIVSDHDMTFTNTF